MNKDELIAFEKDIADAFERKEIRAPIHLSGNNETQLIEIFRDFKQGDWVFSNWRSHYHALLAGIPPEKVKAQIMSGRSMTLCWPEHRFFSSAIFAGCCPIALGVAWQIKRSSGSEKVFCFVGDMCSMSGLFQECKAYSEYWDLPIEWVIENNLKSVCTNTKEVWNITPLDTKIKSRGYNYTLPWPHSGSGRRIQF